jgi:hypothetical protein
MFLWMITILATKLIWQKEKKKRLGSKVDVG